MKKQLAIILTLVFMAGGCSWMNPFSAKKEADSFVFEPNKFLWQAANDKLSALNIQKADKESGTIVTEWNKGGVKNEEFKIEVRVLSSELRSDCLKVVVYKRLWNGSVWIEQPENVRLNQKIEDAVLEKARVLYRNSLAIEN